MVFSATPACSSVCRQATRLLLPVFSIEDFLLLQVACSLPLFLLSLPRAQVQYKIIQPVLFQSFAQPVTHCRPQAPAMLGYRVLGREEFRRVSAKKSVAGAHADLLITPSSACLGTEHKKTETLAARLRG